MIVVTGGAGFIGSALIKALNDLGREDILVIDRKDESNKFDNLKNLKVMSFQDADQFIENLMQFEEAEIDVIFHMGACSSTLEMNTSYLTKNNVDYSKTLFLFATRKNIPIIYASSAATYGDGKNGYNDDHAKVSSLKPLNPYGQSKQEFDEWVLKQKVFPPLWFGIKFFNVFGPFEYHKGDMRSVAHKAFEQISDTGQVKLFKSHRDGYQDGEQLRDFIYVKDAVKALIQMWKTGKSELSGIYNLGTGQARSFKGLVAATFKSMNKELNIKYIDMPTEIREQYQYYTQAEMNKFFNLLPEFKFLSLESAIDDYMAKHLMLKR